MRRTYVGTLEAAIDGTKLPPEQVHSTHGGRPIWVRYDLPAVREALGEVPRFGDRPSGVWRYRELLPLPMDAQPVTLGESATPLLDCPRLAEELGLHRLLVKDESQLPTGSFKSRGMTMALSMARYLGIRKVMLPTAGNAGGAAAAYSARAGIECHVYMPYDTPVVNQMEAVLFGAKVWRVNGLINDCGAIVRQKIAVEGGFDLSTLKEPYRLEGKKTMGLELAEQMGWRCPDVILYPTGGGTGLVGMWKAFGELRELGYLQGRLPRMVSCQSEGCAPIVRAFQTEARFAEPFPNAHTVASGLRVPVAVGDFMILDAIRQSGGVALAGREATVAEWTHRAARLTGISFCPEAALCLDCVAELKNRGQIRPDDTVVLFNTGAAQKYIEALPVDIPTYSAG